MKKSEIFYSSLIRSEKIFIARKTMDGERREVCRFMEQFGHFFKNKITYFRVTQNLEELSQHF